MIIGNILLYAVTAICVIEAVVIVFLLIRKKRKIIISENELREELTQFKYSYDKLKTAYKRVSDDNNFLSEQIRDLKSNIQQLESANLQLLEQKERLKESKQQLEELQKQKDELFSIAVHDIKNPAAAIKGYVELLECYDLNATEQHEIMTNLVESSHQIMELAQEISLVIVKEKSEPVLKKSKASIKKIIDNVCTKNLAYAHKKNVKLINKSSINLPELKIDRSKIEEVIDNLVNNAIKFALPETVVQVKTYYSSSNITVEVADNGKGIHEEELPKLFTKGGTLSSKPTGDELSSGLGLWIVKKIIEEHGGKVSVESKYGVGSSFRFELPFKK